jgi:hypothetical protein
MYSSAFSRDENTPSTNASLGQDPEITRYTITSLLLLRYCRRPARGGHAGTDFATIPMSLPHDGHRLNGVSSDSHECVPDPYGTKLRIFLVCPSGWSESSSSMIVLQNEHVYVPE